MLTESTSLPFLSVGGAIALGIYTILFLKLYSYKDVNLWCRELSSIKAKKLSRSLSCKSSIYMHTLYLLGLSKRYVRYIMSYFIYINLKREPVLKSIIVVAHDVEVTSTGR